MTVVDGDDSNDPLVDLVLMPNRVDPVAQPLASRKDGTASLRSKNNLLVLGGYSDVVVKIGFDVDCVVASPSFWKVFRIIGEEAVLDTSDSLPDGRFPRYIQSPKFDHAACDGVGRHFNNTNLKKGVDNISYVDI